MTTAKILGSVRQQRGRWLIVPVVIVIAPVLVLLKSAIADWDGVPLIASQRVGIELIYQLAGLGLAGVVLSIAYLLAPDGFRRDLPGCGVRIAAGRSAAAEGSARTHQPPTPANSDRQTLDKSTWSARSLAARPLRSPPRPVTPRLTKISGTIRGLRRLPRGAASPAHRMRLQTSSGRPRTAAGPGTPAPARREGWGLPGR